MYISSRSAKDCAETEKELNALGPGTCISLPADIQKLEEVERLVKELSAREKALHVLVNNAGAAWGATLDDYPVRSYFTTVAPRGYASPSTESRGILPGCGMDEAPRPELATRVHPHPEVSSPPARGRRTGRCRRRRLP